MPKHPVYGPPRRSGGQKGNLNALKFIRKVTLRDASILPLGGTVRGQSIAENVYSAQNILPHVGAGGGQGAPSRSGLKTVRAARSGSGSEPFNGLLQGATGGRKAPLSNLDRIIVIKTRLIGGRL